MASVHGTALRCRRMRHAAQVACQTACLHSGAHTHCPCVCVCSFTRACVCVLEYLGCKPLLPYSLSHSLPPLSLARTLTVVLFLYVKSLCEQINTAITWNVALLSTHTHTHSLTHTLSLSLSKFVHWVRSRITCETLLTLLLPRRIFVVFASR